jgi:hypothetical protein
MNSPNPSRIPDCIFEGNFERLFALCKKCLWSATIFKSKAQKSVIIALDTCPTCFDKNIRLIPLLYVRPCNNNNTNQSAQKKQILN